MTLSIWKGSNDAGPLPSGNVSKPGLRRLAPPGISKTQRLTQTSMSEPFPDQTPKGLGLETAGLRPGKKPSKIPTPRQLKAARRKPKKGSSPHKNPIHNLKQQRRHNAGAKTLFHR